MTGIRDDKGKRVIDKRGGKKPPYTPKATPKQNQRQSTASARANAPKNPGMYPKPPRYKLAPGERAQELRGRRAQDEGGGWYTNSNRFKKGSIAERSQRDTNIRINEARDRLPRGPNDSFKPPQSKRGAKGGF